MTASVEESLTPRDVIERISVVNVTLIICSSTEMKGTTIGKRSCSDSVPSHLTAVKDPAALTARNRSPASIRSSIAWCVFSIDKAETVVGFPQQRSFNNRLDINAHKRPRTGPVSDSNLGKSINAAAAHRNPHRVFRGYRSPKGGSRLPTQGQSKQFQVNRAHSPCFNLRTHRLRLREKRFCPENGQRVESNAC